MSVNPELQGTETEDHRGLLATCLDPGSMSHEKKAHNDKTGHLAT